MRLPSPGNPLSSGDVFARQRQYSGRRRRRQLGNERFTVDVGYLEVRDWEVESGRSFEPEEATRGSQVALLGQTVSRQLFQDQDPIGREVRIRNVPFRVIGVLARKGQSTAGQDQDDALLIPLVAGRRVLGSNQVKSRSVAEIS